MYRNVKIPRYPKNRDCSEIWLSDSYYFSPVSSNQDSRFLVASLIRHLVENIFLHLDVLPVWFTKWRQKKSVQQELQANHNMRV